MDPLASNPLSILTFIVAPAMLTNASSILVLGTGNRFARAVDRVRALGAEMKAAGVEPGWLSESRVLQLRYAQRRAKIVVRALTSFYFAVGSFAAASLISLLAAGFSFTQHNIAQQVSLDVGFVVGVGGVLGLVVGSGMLVLETRLTLYIIGEETRAIERHCSDKSSSAS